MIYPFLLTISQFTISISKIWCTLVYIAESLKPGSKRFNSIKKTMHFAHLVALFIYKYRILCSKRQTGVISLNFRTWVGERERGRDRRRERGGESEWERERVCGVKSLNLRRGKSWLCKIDLKVGSLAHFSYTPTYSTYPVGWANSLTFS